MEREEVIRKYPHGTISEKFYRINRKKEGKYESWWEDERRLLLCNYKNNELDGRYKRWHENGNLAEVSNFKNGNRNGMHEMWNYNGGRDKRCNYKNGMYNGKYEAWYSSGRRCVIRNHKYIEEGYNTPILSNIEGEVIGFDRNNGNVSMNYMINGVERFDVKRKDKWFNFKVGIRKIQRKTLEKIKKKVIDYYVKDIKNDVLIDDMMKVVLDYHLGRKDINKLIKSMNKNKHIKCLELYEKKIEKLLSEETNLQIINEKRKEMQELIKRKQWNTVMLMA